MVRTDSTHACMRNFFREQQFMRKSLCLLGLRVNCRYSLIHFMQVKGFWGEDDFVRTMGTSLWRRQAGRCVRDWYPPSHIAHFL